MPTKKQLIEELKKFGVEATLRPRKAVLQELLKSKIAESTRKGCSGWYKKVEKVCDPKKKDFSWLLGQGILYVVFFAVIVIGLFPW